MKRSIALALSAVGLATICTITATAEVHVSLNIRYTDPADVSEGGVWTLVAKTDTVGSNGISGLSTRFSDIPAAGVVHPSIGHDSVDGLLTVHMLGDDVEFIYSQSTGPGGAAPVTGVDKIGGPSDQGPDPLDHMQLPPGSAFWDNASVIASGTLPDGVRPLAVTASANEFDASNVQFGSNVADFVVRGDSLASQGLGDLLLRGDADRDFDVDAMDVILTYSGFTGDGIALSDPEDEHWMKGDFDDDADVDAADIGYALAAFTANLPGDPTKNPYLLYDPASGAVRLIPHGAEVLSFQIKSAGQFNIPMTTADLVASTSASPVRVDSSANTLGWASSTGPSGDGFGNRPEDEAGALLGNVFPTGLDQNGLNDLLTSNDWVGPGGTGGVFDLALLSADFDLDVDGDDFLQWQRGDVPDLPDPSELLAIWEASYGAGTTWAVSAAVPEPATGILLLLAAVGVVALRSR